MLISYSLKKGRAKFYRPETIVVSLLLLMVLSFKVIFNQTSKRQFVVLHFTGILKEKVYLVPNPCKLPETFCKGFMLIFLPGDAYSNVL